MDLQLICKIIQNTPRTINFHNKNNFKSGNIDRLIEKIRWFMSHLFNHV